jgi:very-short-patch-repair endonuclease
MQWWELARAQGGAVSHTQLRAGGLSTSSISRMAESGELVRLSRGVYLAAGAPLTELARLWVAQLATNGVLADQTAGRLWGVYDECDGMVHMIIEPHRHITVPPGVRVRRTELPRETVRVRSGLAVTSRAWTVLDLLGSVEPAQALRLADRAVQRQWIDQDDCARRLREYPRRRGNARLRIIADRLGDGAAADSERILHRLLRKAGIHGWTANKEIWASGELVGVVDVAIPSRRIAIEVDGMAYHVDVDRFRRDRAKQNALVALGWTVLRFTWADLTERPGYVIATIQRIAA